MARQEEATLLLRVKESGLDSVKKVGQAFDDLKVEIGILTAAMTGFAASTVAAFGESQEAINGLKISIANAGLPVERLTEKYLGLAAAIQTKTKFSDDEITKSIALGQAMAGNIELTDELIRLTVDFASAKGMSLSSAFELIGKSIGSSNNALSRYGIEVDTTGTKQEKLRDITKALQERFEGFAESQGSTVTGSVVRLKNTFGDLLEVIGSRFAPIIQRATNLLSQFINEIKNNSSILKWITIITGVTIAVGGLITALNGVAMALRVLRTLLLALTSPIGLIVTAIVGLATAWETNVFGIQQVTFGVFNAIQNFFDQFVERTSKIFSNLGSVLHGAFTFDLDEIKAGLQGIVDAFQTAGEETVKAFEEGQKKKSVSILPEGLKDFVGNFGTEQAPDSTVPAQTINDVNSNSQMAKDLGEDFGGTALDIFANGLTSFFQGGAKSLTANVVSGVVGIWSDALGQLAGSFIETFGVATEEFEKKMEGMFDVQFQENMHKNAMTFIKTLQENLPEIIRMVVREGLADLPNVMALMIDLMSDPQFWVDLMYAFVKGVWEGLLAAFQGIGGIFSDTWKDILYGGWGSFLEGIPSETVKVKEWFVNGWSSFVDTLGDYTTSIGGWFTDGWTSFVNGLGGFVGYIESFFNDGWKGFLKNLDPREMFKKFDFDDIIVNAFKKAVDWVNENLVVNVSGMGGGGGGGGGGVLGGARKKLGFNHGGLVPNIQKFANGGTVDTVPAMLTPGEFVVNREATNRNLGLLQSINGGGGGSGTVINITVNGGLLGDAQTAKQFAMAIDEQLLKLRQGNNSISFDKGVF